MKKINLYILALISFLPAFFLCAQERKYDIRPGQFHIERIGDGIRMTVNLNLENLDLPSQQMITLTPVVRSADKSKYHEFSPVVITGGARNKALKRSLEFGNFKFQKPPQLMLRHKNSSPENIPLVLELPYEEWLHEADLYFIEDVTGCACKVEDNSEFNIPNILPPLFIPEYKLSYATPPVEEVKRRSETYSALINFELNKYKILYNYKNNAQVLDEVDRIINEIRNDANLTITEFSITGYASPEGVPQHNMKLSENRARSFVSYLMDKYTINAAMIKTDWKGEDWDGLRKVVEDLRLDNKEQILDVLSETDVMTRKSKLKQLNGGETYRMLLKEYYPPLRRNEYTIAYIAKPFSIDEAKATIKTKPQHLSENEIFLVANTYPKNSREFKEAFDIASRLYPDNPYTRMNVIALDIENGNNDHASLIRRMQNVDIPEAWNNMGIMYAEQGNYEKAQEAFNKAANTGLREAVYNKEQLSRYLENNINVR